MDKMFLGKIAAAIAIIAFILSKIGLEKIAPILLSINPVYLALSYIIVLISLATHSLNLKILLNPIKKISWRKSFKYYSYGWALGAVTPARLGEYSVAYFLQSDDIEKSKSIAIITIDKAMTF